MIEVRTSITIQTKDGRYIQVEATNDTIEAATSRAVEAAKAAINPHRPRS